MINHDSLLQLTKTITQFSGTHVCFEVLTNAFSQVSQSDKNQQKHTTKMKLNNQYKRKAAGMTLLELTVVILVLLGLISVLFFGAQAYIRGSERTQCVMNIRKCQLAVRGYANLNNIRQGATLAVATITGEGNFLETQPVCPGDGAAYTYGTVVPDIGVLYAACGNADATIAGTHIPGDYQDW